MWWVTTIGGDRVGRHQLLEWDRISGGGANKVGNNDCNGCWLSLMGRSWNKQGGVQHWWHLHWQWREEQHYLKREDKCGIRTKQQNNISENSVIGSKISHSFRSSDNTKRKWEHQDLSLKSPWWPRWWWQTPRLECSWYGCRWHRGRARKRSVEEGDINRDRCNPSRINRRPTCAGRVAVIPSQARIPLKCIMN